MTTVRPRFSRVFMAASAVALAGAGFILASALDSRLLEDSRVRAPTGLRVASVIFVYGTAQKEQRSRHRQAAEAGAARMARFLGAKARVAADCELTIRDRREAHLVLLGRPEANSVVAEVADRLPGRFTADGFAFGGRDYDQPEHLLSLAVGSPWNRQRLILVIAGARPETRFVRRNFRLRAPYYLIEEAGRTLRYGRLRHGRLDAPSDVDLEREQENWRSGLATVSTPHFEIEFPRERFAEAEIRDLADRLERRFDRARLLLGREVELCIRTRLYPSIEAKGRLTDSVALADVEGDSRTVDAVVAAEGNGIEEAREMGFLVDEAWGSSAFPHLGRGLERRLAGSNGWLEAARLIHQGFEPNLDRLERLGAAVYDPFAASWVDFLHERLGREVFFALYRGEAAADLAELSREWRLKLELEARAHEVPFAAEAARSRAAYRLPPWQKGFNYAYSNSRESGYATERSHRSLTALRRVGANAVALVPYGFSSPGELHEIRRAGKSLFTESDESLRVAVRHARALGLTVLLKPQIWISGDFWPSEIDFAAETDWERWFQSYRDWILPYALLAEELRVDLFCIGTELSRAAVEHPDRFRELIARIRRVYHGPLTYAANWHGEFEQVSFWDAVDWIGLNNYYPLAARPPAGESELRAGALEVASRVEAVARREGKPVVFTEVGFPSRRAAGLAAGAAAGLGAETDLERQALLYRITFETYWDRPWCAGLYWWKWFSDPANAGPAGDEWTPRGKPAEEVVYAWFRKESPASSIR